MTLLTIIQDAADEIGIPQPTAVVGNTDPQAKQLLALSNRGGKALARRHTWSVLITEATFTTLAAELQGALSDLATGYDAETGIIDGTIYNRTNQDRIAGPISPQRWQADQASSLTGPYHDYRIRLGNLYLTPVPTAGQTGAFEYKSVNWCQSGAGAGQVRWVDDTDTGIIPEDLLTGDLVWRFLAAKGLEYAEAFRSFELSVQSAAANDGGNEVLSLNGRRERRDVSAPDGSWAL